MRNFPSEKALVKAYWRKLARSIRIEVLDGLKENTKVVMNPTDDLREGIQVEVKLEEKSKPEKTVVQTASNR